MEGRVLSLAILVFARIAAGTVTIHGLSGNAVTVAENLTLTCTVSPVSTTISWTTPSSGINQVCVCQLNQQCLDAIPGDTITCSSDLTNTITFIMTDVKENDGGTYTCRHETGPMETATVNISISVQGGCDCKLGTWKLVGIIFCAIVAGAALLGQIVFLIIKGGCVFELENGQIAWHIICAIVEIVAAIVLLIVLLAVKDECDCDCDCKLEAGDIVGIVICCLVITNEVILLILQGHNPQNQLVRNDSSDESEDDDKIKKTKKKMTEKKVFPGKEVSMASSDAVARNDSSDESKVENKEEMTVVSQAAAEARNDSSDESVDDDKIKKTKKKMTEKKVFPGKEVSMTSSDAVARDCQHLLEQRG